MFLTTESKTIRTLYGNLQKRCRNILCHPECLINVKGHLSNPTGVPMSAIIDTLLCVGKALFGLGCERMTAFHG